MALQRIYGQIIYWDSSIGDVLPNTNIAIGTKAVDVGDGSEKSEWDGTTWLAGWHFNTTEFIHTANGTASAYKPIKLNSQGQIDPSMLDTSSFYPVGEHDPSGGTEYPDETGQSHGAFWMVNSLANPTDPTTDPVGDPGLGEPYYRFTTGDLIDKAIRVGDFIVWGSAGWSIMAGEMNPTLYYKLDGSNHLTGNMHADNHKLTMVADGSDVQDVVNKRQLDLKADLSFVNTENDAQDTEINKKVNRAGDVMTGSLGAVEYIRVTGNASGAGAFQMHHTDGTAAGSLHHSTADYANGLKIKLFSNNGATVNKTLELHDSGVAIDGYDIWHTGSFDPTLKADLSYVESVNATQDTEIALKAYITDVDAKNADQDALIALKADITYVDSENAVQDAIINAKVDRAGDVMTGDLTSPNFIITGSSPSHNIPSTGSVLTLDFDPADGSLVLTQDSGTNVSTDLDGRYELLLGNPTADGMVLSSTVAGARSWIEMSYTNAEATPIEHGGIPAGSTFDSVPLVQMWTDVLYPYQAPTFDAFSIGDTADPVVPIPTAIEVGGTMATGDYTFTWGTTNDGNIKTDSVAVRDHTADVDLGAALANDGSEVLTMPADITYAVPTTHIWRVQATNSKDTVFSKDFSVSWRWKTFWGNDADGTITAADILAGSSRLDADGVGEYHPPQATPGEYKWLAYSTDYAMASKIYDKGSGADVVMDPGYNPATIEITNAQGVVVEMYVYRTLNATEADLTMVVEGATKEAQDNNEPRDPIPGTLPISGMVAPLDAADQYPVTDDQFNKGGYRTVATMADMDPGIDPLKRKPGMMVYVQENGNKYILDDDLTTWVIDGGGVPVGGATWDVLRKSSTADFATEWAESPGAFIQDIAWADLVAMQVAGNIRQWDKYRITDQSNRLIEIKLQSPDGSSWFEVINDEGTVTLLKVE